MLREAIMYAKRMDHRLKEYSQQYDAGWWESNQDYAMDLDRRLAVDYVALDDEGVSDAVLAIPSMGGREIGRHLRDWSSMLREGEQAVELGCWLGAGTAQMALGIKSAGLMMSKVHSFDKFSATFSQIEKAKAVGMSLQRGDTTIVVMGLLKSAGVLDYVKLHKGQIGAQSWDDGKIGLYVDDACKREEAFVQAIRTFGPSWIPERTVIVLMDFWYYKRKGADAGLRFQSDWMNRHAHNFEVVERTMLGTSAAAFRFIGGEPWKTR